ncbi:cytidylate kinase [Algimonas arctica]|uniref:Cytidylate kinase n=1 Tax=Algimonas arctica TaxID=1479486 RepID=A0A8J3G2E6_9PROT|nr:(d)CMP kinase [Algimonas arctica]GHA94864.1 cytidylate kinase [Algimonas arctica]
MTHPLNIAIDGTFSSGKGTLSRRIAAHYGLACLDTGKLYRAVARDVLAAGVSLAEGEQAAVIAAQIDPSTLDDPYLKSGEIGAAASKVSVHPPVRAALLAFQRDFAAKGAVLDGRDIGTVICPDADAKLFVTADPEVRAERRYQELLGYGEDVTLAGVLSDLTERDHRDMNRRVAPLKPAVDAHLLDTTDLSIERAVSTAIRMIDAVLDANA